MSDSIRAESARHPDQYANSVHLRDYQEQALADVRSAMRRHRRVLLQAPTGAGKTVIFAELARRVSLRGKRVCILVHRRELLRQTCAKLADAGVAHATIEASAKGVSRSTVSVASVQTLARRLQHYAGAFDLIVVDEAHHAVAGQWRAITDAYPTAYVLGVTATPSRLDGRGLGDAFDDLIVGPTPRELIAADYLADYAAFAPPGGGPDLSGIRTRMGDYEAKGLAACMSAGKLVGDAVEHYERHADGRPAVAFCVTVAHAEAVAETFRASGYSATAVDGSLDNAERERRIAGLANGQVQVLTSCDLISEGLDIPGISAAILLRPTKSLGLYLQQVGRALRPKPDGSRAVILDHAGNVLMHGLPCVERPWSLTAPKKAKEKGRAPVRQCMECYAFSPAGAAECEQCGTAFPKATREVEHEDGRLVEVRGSQFYGADGRPIVERTRTSIERAVASCQDIEDLKALRRALGFKVGWERHIVSSDAWAKRSASPLSEAAA